MCHSTIIRNYKKPFGVLIKSSYRKKVLSYNSDKDYSEIHVTIHEGKFHQVKRMFTAIGSEVLFLKRITFGALPLDESLKTGEYRALTKEEISILQRNQIKR